MDNLTTRFVDCLYKMSIISDHPKEVTDKAHQCFLDYLSVVIGGSVAYRRINVQYIQQNQINGKCHVFGLPDTVDLSTAVMMNAYNAHVLELDDSHREAMTHLGAPIISALLGVSELYGSTYEELLRGVVVGYDAAIKLANAIQPSHKNRGFHVSGTCCTVGAAIGIATMLHYSKEEMSNVFSAAVTAAAGLLAVISGNSEQKPYNISNAAVAGVHAALYGKYFAGAVDILGDSRGFFHAVCDSCQTEKLFSESYAILGIYQKLYAACRHCHAPMEAMLILQKKYAIDYRNISKIIVKVYGLAINGHDHTEVYSVSSAKQSIPYGVAAACILRDCGLGAFSKEQVRRTDILALTGKVRIEEDEELSRLVPDKRPAIVTVYLNDGTVYSERVDYAKGEPENEITPDEWYKKFNSLAKFGGFENTEYEQMTSFLMKSRDIPAKEIFRMIK